MFGRRKASLELGVDGAGMRKTSFSLSAACGKALRAWPRHLRISSMR